MITNANSGNQDNFADRAAVSADNAIRSTQEVLNQALDHLSGDVHDLQRKTSPFVDRATSQAQALARNGMVRARSTSQQLRASVQDTTNNARGYIRDEPVKSVLIAAAAGAALVGLLSLLGHGKDR